MEHPPAPGALAIQWQAPGDGPVADHLARVALRQHQRREIGATRPAVAWAAVVVIGGVLVVATWPVGLVLVALGGLLVLWGKVLAPRQWARNLRRLPSADEPYTVTLDGEGLHVVGPSVADHLRWKLFEKAWVDEDVLVLRRRGARLTHVVPLMALDPAVDRAWLVAEVNRAIAAGAPVDR